MFSKPTPKTLILAWPLLAGMAMIMAGNGLQGTLLSLRAGLEGFSIIATGILMSLYYGGYLAGCYVTPRLINSVGHIRVFAGMASLASTTILCNGLFIDPAAWGAMRFLSGISFAALFIVAESWLNDIAPSGQRAKIFGSYLFVINGALFAGQFMIALAPVTHIALFILVSILISLSLMPITLANKPSPAYAEPEKLSLRTLFRQSPLAICGSFAAGFAGATIMTLGPVYMQNLGFKEIQAAYFTAAYILGCALLPFVLGWASDKFDRRKFIIILSFCAFILAFGITLFAKPPVIAVFLLGGIVCSLYGVSVSYMNDQLSSAQILSASTTLILTNGMGAIAGPVLVSIFMQWGQIGLFFPVISSIFLLLGIFGIMRVFYGHKVVVEEQGSFTPLPARSGIHIMEIIDPPASDV